MSNQGIERTALALHSSEGAGLPLIPKSVRLNGGLVGGGGVEHRARRGASIFGLAVALAIDALWLFTLFPYMSPNPWRVPIAALTCLVQTALTTGGIVLAAHLHGRLGINVWLAVPYGAAAGAVVGAISLGVSIGLRTLLGLRAGMIVMQQEAAFLNTATVVRQFVEGFGGGVAFGLVGGLIPGAAGSLALALWLRRQVSRLPSAEQADRADYQQVEST